MPPVGDLDRVRRTVAGAVGKRRPGPGRPPPHRSGRVSLPAKSSGFRPISTSTGGARRPGGPAPFRSGAAGAARTHPHRAPSPDRSADPVAHGSTAASIDRLATIPNDAANRDPARPAKASPTATNATCRPALRRACRTVNHTTSGRPENGQISHPPPIAAVHPSRYRPHRRQRDPRARPLVKPGPLTMTMCHLAMLDGVSERR